MKIFRYLCSAILLTVTSLNAISALADSLGQVESFGDDGKFFSKSVNATETRSYYLLTRQTHVSETVNGYEGDARVVIENKNGGFEVKLFHYGVYCTVTGNHPSVSPSVIFSEHHQELQFGTDNHPVDRTMTPAASKRISYNFFWAVCQAKFNKYK